MARRRNSTREKNIFGAGIMVVGVLLLMWSRKLAYSLGGQIQYVFTGSPGDKPVLLMIAGSALIAVGMYQVFWKQ